MTCKFTKVGENTKDSTYWCEVCGCIAYGKTPEQAKIEQKPEVLDWWNCGKWANTP